MYCVCASPAGDTGSKCVVCGEVVPIIVPVDPYVEICPKCSRRESYESMEFLKDAQRCPGCGKK